ncbi:MAG TPA: LCP family protein [Candidatus Dormibacteraeota bacterium]|nr:LCP family protein [Candidatus Dormibacteraeota bacterium]
MDNKQRRSSINTDGFLNSLPESRQPLARPINSVPPNSQTPSPPPNDQIPSKINNSSSIIPSFSTYYSPASREPLASSKSLQPNSRPKHFRKRLKRTALVGLMLILISGGWYGSRLIGSIDKLFHGSIFSDVHALLSQTHLNGESTGRVNILLAGYQGSESDEGPLTDSIMVVSIDTQNQTAFTISIPRDLWVDIPGKGHQKINAANTYTDFNQSGYFSGGMGQLQQVVEQELGIPINYYALIDYTAFEDAVNAVNGITVNIQSSDPRGLYDPNVDKAHGGPLKIPNGPVNLNGRTALALALARGDSPYAYGFPTSDINRTEHQRQMLIALEQKASSAGVLGNPITIAKLVSSVGNNVTTDLNLSDVLRLAQLTKGLNPSNIHSAGLSYGGTKPLLTSYIAPDGEDALIPKAGLDNFSQIQNFYQQLTSNNPVVKEDPTVVILNASNINNLAHKQATIMTSKGFSVIGTVDASNEYPASMVVDLSNGQKPASRQVLGQMFTTNTTFVTTANASSEASEAQGYTADFVIILGQNWKSTSQ